MAPHAEDPVRVDYQTPLFTKFDTTAQVPWLSSKQSTTAGPDREHKSLSARYEPGHIPPETYEDYEYDALRPSFPDLHWEELKDIPYEEKGIRGNPRFRNLLDAAEDVFDYVPKIGTEIHGLKLTQLTDAQKCDLARLIATRGVVFFRNQDDFDIKAQRELGKFFGNLHKHATTAMPQRGDLEDVHVVYTTDKSVDQRALFTPTFLWHSDVGRSEPPSKWPSSKH